MAAPAAGADRAARAPDASILLVEDDDVVRQLAVRILAGHGYDVTEAASGEHALELADGREGGFDLVVSDVVMPGISGPVLVRALRATRRAQRILYVSGYSADALVPLGVRPCDLLEKPFTAAGLLAAVERSLAA